MCALDARCRGENSFARKNSFQFRETKERSDKTLWTRSNRAADVIVYECSGHAEEVRRVVLGFQGDEAVVVVAVSGLKSAVVPIVHHEIHVASPSCANCNGIA
jgi:hypothetical protein